MKKNRITFPILLCLSILFTFTFVKTSETHHIVTADAEFSKRCYIIPLWTYYGCAGLVKAPLKTKNNQNSTGWFRIKVYIDGKGHNVGFDYVAKQKDGFNFMKHTSKTVWGAEGDDNVTGFADSRLTNQEDYDWDYDNVPEWQ